MFLLAAVINENIMETIVDIVSRTSPIPIGRPANRNFVPIEKNKPITNNNIFSLYFTFKLISGYFTKGINWFYLIWSFQQILGQFGNKICVNKKE